jgi:bacteriocin-like protein
LEVNNAVFGYFFGEFTVHNSPVKTPLVNSDMLSISSSLIWHPQIRCNLTFLLWRNIMDNLLKKISRISHQKIPAVAAEGVERALAARSEKLRELSEEELSQISGGALAIKLELINGGRMELMKSVMNASNVANPALNPGLANQFNSGMAGF